MLTNICPLWVFTFPQVPKYCITPCYALAKGIVSSLQFTITKLTEVSIYTLLPQLLDFPLSNLLPLVMIAGILLSHRAPESVEVTILGPCAPIFRLDTLPHSLPRFLNKLLDNDEIATVIPSPWAERLLQFSPPPPGPSTPAARLKP